MKKILVVLAAAVLVLSFAGAAFAIHAEIPADTQAVVGRGTTQLTIGGEIRVRGWYYNNMAPYFTAAVPGNPQDSNSKANWDQRVRLFVDVNVSPNVSGRIHMETGAVSDTDIYAWGNLNSKPGGLNSLLEAWIQYKGTGLFGFNSGVKVGHMPLKLGEGIFFDNTQFGDDAVVFFMDPTKELHIGLLTIKASEIGVGGNTSTGQNTNDLDAYVALATYKIAPTHTLGINYTFINESDVELKFQNLGIHANGTVGKFGYKAEVDFQFGDVMDVDFKGWAAFVAANYRFTPSFNGRLSFAYGSGQGDDDDDIKEFQTLVGTIQHYSFVYDYRARTAAQLQVLSGRQNTTGTGIANTTVYNAGLDWQATKDLGFTLDGYYFRASKNATGGSKNIGWEVDASMKYQIAKNLTYVINAGYFDAGSFYEEKFWAPISEAKSATILNNILTLSF